MIDMQNAITILVLIYALTITGVKLRYRHKYKVKKRKAHELEKEVEQLNKRLVHMAGRLQNLESQVQTYKHKDAHTAYLHHRR